MGHFLHLASLAGVCIFAHRFWPKGIVYSELEDWEKSHHWRNTHPQKPPKSSSKAKKDSRDEYEYVYRKERGQRRSEREKYDHGVGARPTRDVEYGTRPVYSGHAKFMDHEYDEYEAAPSYSKRATPRY